MLDRIVPGADGPAPRPRRADVPPLPSPAAQPLPKAPGGRARSTAAAPAGAARRHCPRFARSFQGARRMAQQWYTVRSRMSPSLPPQAPEASSTVNPRPSEAPLEGATELRPKRPFEDSQDQA
eukprot:1603662-Pyramimonas_sp.AAC.1